MSGDRLAAGLDSPPSNLPLQLTSFVGREAEIAEVERLHETARLLTLTGAGGCGKTRLASQAASGLLDRHPDGVWWVDLGPLSDPAVVPAAVAHELRIDELPPESIIETLKAALRERSSMIVLDNCEHLLDACADLVEELLAACPDVSILATSREPLGIEGEITFRVPSLAVPEVGVDEDSARIDGVEAVRLFCERAQQSRPDFGISDANRRAVAEICRRLDGIPLAIELAASRVRVLSPRQIEEALADRFALLTGARRAVPRQQTLRASVDWSHQLLSAGEREVLRRASVFAGGFTIEAAEVVCAGDDVDRYSVLQFLSQLVDRSLVQFEEVDGAARYRLSETIRQYAAEKLTEAGEGLEARSHHLDHYVALAEEAEPQLERGEQLLWLERLDREQANLQAASDWATRKGPSDRGARLAAALWNYWLLRSRLSEGRSRLERALASDDAEPVLRAKLLIALSNLLWLSGDWPEAHGLLEEALRLGRASGDAWTVGRALHFLGEAGMLSDRPQGGALLEEAVEASRKAGDSWFLADSLSGLGFYKALVVGDSEAAGRALAESLALGRESGHRRVMARALGWRGLASVCFTAEPGEAEDLLRAALEGAREVGDGFLTSLVLCYLGFALAHHGDFEPAGDALAEARQVASDYQNAFATAVTAGFVGELERWTGATDTTRRRLEDAVRLSVAKDIKMLGVWWMDVHGALARDSGSGGVARQSFEAALARSVEAPAAFYHGRLLHDMALLAEEEGDWSEAERRAYEALAIAARAGMAPLELDSLELIAHLVAAAGSHVEATRLVAAVDADRRRRHCVRTVALRRRLDRLLPSLREELGDPGYEEAWGAGAALSLEDATAYASRGRGTRKRPTSGWASLTPAELQVVRLAAEGLTNPQIGEALFVSKRTVQTHLAHVFRKLDVSSRAELAAEASRQAEK